MGSFKVLRRTVAWTMLGLYGLVVSGLPLPVSLPTAGTRVAGKLAGKDRSRPFPCMDKACGCDSADQCFSSCCCHTPAETLRWAEARRIEPAVIEALQRRVAAAAAPDGCCSGTKRLRPSCCAADEAIAGPADAVCSEERLLTAEPVDPPARPDADQPVMKVVILRAMLACGGIVAQWASVGVSLPPPGIVSCEIPWPPVGAVAMVDEWAAGTGGPPDLPPPRG